MTDMYDLAGVPRPPFCINCKHLAKSSMAGAENWKCLAEQNIISRETDLVTGETIVKRHFLTCYDARAADVKRHENCGPEGKWFEPAPPKFEEPSRILPGSVNKLNRPVTDLLDQLDKMG